MNDSVLDETQITREILGLRLLESHQYWLGKRILFNILVGIAGLLSVIFFLPGVTVFDFAGVFIWGVVANGLYSFGYVCESYIITKTKWHQESRRVRKWLFWSGTILYIVVSVAVPFFSFFLAPL